MDRLDPPTRLEVGPLASRISREVVQLHANLYGRGPTRAKTHLGDDYALCILEDFCFTTFHHRYCRVSGTEIDTYDF